MKENHSVIQILFIILILIFSIPYILSAQPPGKIYPIECKFTKKALEPSGVTLHKGRLLFVSDNNNDNAVYELVPGKDAYSTKIFLDINSNDIANAMKRHALDLEGIVKSKNNFYCVDEKDRYFYKIDFSGRLKRIFHDIDAYNRINGIAYSRKTNAGFEGIAYDSFRDIFFIINERDDAIIYLLALIDNVFFTINHISMSKLSGGSVHDISDIYYFREYLYTIDRTGRNIIKLNPYRIEIPPENSEMFFI